MNLALNHLGQSIAIGGLAVFAKLLKQIVLLFIKIWQSHLQQTGRLTKTKLQEKNSVKIHFRYGSLFNNILLILSVFVFCSISIMAQKTATFQKPGWLNECDPENNKIDERILYEYGAVYLSMVFESKDSKKPSKCRFITEKEIASFAESFNKPPNKPVFGNFYLQPQARESLKKVFLEMGGYKYVARNCNETIKIKVNNKNKIVENKEKCTNGINNDWAFRDYRQTMCNWTDQKQCDRKFLLLNDEKLAILDPIFDETKSYYDQALLRPMMLKFAIPGGSQHHLGLAIDVNNGTGNSDITNCKKTNNCRVCETNCVESLERHEWYRTVKYDPYHFTFLGFSATELPSKGLKKVRCKDSKYYWVPRVENESYPNWGCENVK